MADRQAGSVGVVAPGSRRGPCGRRRFVLSGAAGLAGALLAPACGRAGRDAASAGPAPPPVRLLGRTGLRLPAVSIGSAHDPGLVRAALDAGLVYVHTSSAYEEQNHERMLGEALRGRPRESFVIGSSPDLPYRFERGQPHSADVGRAVDPAGIAASLEGSLTRLGLDAIDIYYLASVGERATALHEPYIRAFDALKRAGTIRFTGLTTHRNEPAVIRAAVESGFWDVVLTSYNFRQTHRGEVRAAMREAAAAGLGVIVMKTQAGVYWDSLRLRKINMKAALKWALQDEYVHTSVPAFSNHDELRDDLSVLQDLTLTTGELDDLGLGDRLGLAGLYCQQCGACLAQCPSHADVPALMRAHMYAAGYGQAPRARRLLDAAVGPHLPCEDCSRCDVRCAQGFDVRARARRVASIAREA